MRRLLLTAFAIAAHYGLYTAAESLTVSSDFEGASVADVSIDQPARTINFTPGGDPSRGWPCWWYFRVDGIAPGETIALHLRGSTATVATPSSPLNKPLDPKWAMPARATFSTDGRTWHHTADGALRDGRMTYTLSPNAPSVFVAWGPPYTPYTAAAFVRAMADASPHAQAMELCRSRENRSVPMLRVREGPRPDGDRFGVWVQARQHAWESGSSWVAQGFAEWLLRADDPDAAWLRGHAEVFIVPIMDVDNAATGNGGKDADPHDHNRDWSDRPHWPEVAAARQHVAALTRAGRMDLFLDLHNPAPADQTFFYVLPADQLPAPAVALRDRFMALARARFEKMSPPFPLRDAPQETGPSYHPLWRQISSNFVAVNGNPHTVSLCLETAWNTAASTADGYRAVGASLAAAAREYLAEQPARLPVAPPR